MMQRDPSEGRRGRKADGARPNETNLRCHALAALNLRWIPIETTGFRRVELHFNLTRGLHLPTRHHWLQPRGASTSTSNPIFIGQAEIEPPPAKARRYPGEMYLTVQV